MRVWIFLTLILISSFAWTEPSSAALEKTQVALNWKPEPEFGGFYAGTYAKNGLDATILPGGSGTPVVQMIAAGKVDFGTVSADEIVISQANGSDVVGIFAVFQTNPQGVMVHADRGFNSIGDVLKGDGVLAMQRGLPYSEYLLKKYGPSGPPKVKIVPYLGGVSNFFNDKKYSQQVFVTSEPLEAKKKSVPVKTFLIADEGYNPYTVVLATRASLIKKNPKLVKAMVASVREGWREYLDKPERFNQKIGELNKSMDAQTIAMSTEAQRPLIETDATKKNGLGSMEEARWSALVDQLSDLKLVKKKPAAAELFKSF